MIETLETYLEQQRIVVEQHLDQMLQLEVGCPPALLEAMRYSVLAPGKRLRPILVMLAVEAAGGRAKDALPAEAAVEFVHVYSLIHDDLPAMDDDDLRRGQPTCHKQFGEALAILAGDALLTLAFEVLTAHLAPKTAAACCRELARGAGAAGMVGGQVEDLAWEAAASNGTVSYASSGVHGDSDRMIATAERQPTVAVLENIHARKTGALFRSALRMGAYVAQGERDAGVDRTLLARLDEYGQCFGQAFQIVDDLLDHEGNAKLMGKRAQKDASRGKLTYPGFWGVEESRRRARLLVDRARVLVQPLGAAGRRLQELVTFVLERKR